MNLKRLHETASWHKLNEVDFKAKATRCILEQNDELEKHQNLINQLTEDLHLIKRQLSILNLQNIKLGKNTRNQRTENDTKAEQKRNSQSISQSR
ncbi:MAG: hypothetical protein WC905_03255 [Patescibacteria group bacterium]|jgi:hypothetical protein